MRPGRDFRAESEEKRKQAYELNLRGLGPFVERERSTGTVSRWGSRKVKRRRRQTLGADAGSNV